MVYQFNAKYICIPLQICVTTKYNFYVRSGIDVLYFTNVNYSKDSTIHNDDYPHPPDTHSIIEDIKKANNPFFLVNVTIGKGFQINKHQILLDISYNQNLKKYGAENINSVYLNNYLAVSTGFKF